MPPLVPDNVPTHFAQGTTVKFTRNIPDFPPSNGWTYTIYLNGLTAKYSKAAAVQDPATFLIEISPTDSATLAPGPYRYAERLTNPGTAFVLTGVTIDGAGNATYSFSSYSNLDPFVGMLVTIAGFTNAGNNVATAMNIAALTGGPGGGTFTIPNAGAVNEAHPATAQGAQEIYDITGDELVLTVEPSAASSAAGAFQSFEEKQLAWIEAAITARSAGTSSPDIEAYHIAGRSVSKMSLADLYKLRGTLRAVVWRMQHPGKLSVPRRVRFNVEEEYTTLPPTWQDVTGLDRA